MNLNDSDLDQFADFLGHDISVHRKYYRLPEGTLQLAKASKILMVEMFDHNADIDVFHIGLAFHCTQQTSVVCH